MSGKVGWVVWRGTAIADSNKMRWTKVGNVFAMEQSAREFAELMKRSEPHHLFDVRPT